MPVSVQPPFLVVNDLNGQPIDSGYVYIGTANTNPVTNPIAIFSDPACTISLSNPVRTSGGFCVDGTGTPVNIYVAGDTDFSLAVANRFGAVLYSVASYPVRLLSASITFGTLIVNTSILPDAAGGAFIGSTTLPFSDVVTQDLQAKTAAVYDNTQPAVTADFAKLTQRAVDVLVANQTSVGAVANNVNLLNCASITRTAAGQYDIVPTVALPATFSVQHSVIGDLGNDMETRLFSSTTTLIKIRTFLAGVATDASFAIWVKGNPGIADPIL